jgi:hypothetical protein
VAGGHNLNVLRRIHVNLNHAMGATVLGYIESWKWQPTGTPPPWSPLRHPPFYPAVPPPQPSGLHHFAPGPSLFHCCPMCFVCLWKVRYMMVCNFSVTSPPWFNCIYPLSNPGTLVRIVSSLMPSPACAHRAPLGHIVPSPLSLLSFLSSFLMTHRGLMALHAVLAANSTD